MTMSNNFTSVTAWTYKGHIRPNENKRVYVPTITITQMTMGPPGSWWLCRRSGPRAAGQRGASAWGTAAPAPSQGSSTTTTSSSSLLRRTKLVTTSWLKDTLISRRIGQIKWVWLITYFQSKLSVLIIGQQRIWWCFVKKCLSMLMILYCLYRGAVFPRHFLPQHQFSIWGGLQVCGSVQVRFYHHPGEAAGIHTAPPTGLKYSRNQPKMI